MPADFAGQVVWITGASSGIGEALARGFAQAGARLVLSSRREIELERVRRTCARPDEHLVLPLDLACTDAFAAATATVLARCGAIDVLVNNAGVAQRALAGEATLAVERALMDVNYFGPVALTKAVLPAMRARRRGHVVVVGSVLGHFGFPGNSTYSAAKHALRVPVHFQRHRGTGSAGPLVGPPQGGSAFGASGGDQSTQPAFHVRAASQAPESAPSPCR